MAGGHTSCTTSICTDPSHPVLAWLKILGGYLALQITPCTMVNRDDDGEGKDDEDAISVRKLPESSDA